MPDTWAWANSGAGSDYIMDLLAPYLRISKRCGRGGTRNDCFGDNTYNTLNPSVNWLNGNPSNTRSYSSTRLDNGFMIWILSDKPSCTGIVGTRKALMSYCGAIGVDINGLKPPNVFGKDTFYFHLTKYGVVPMGVKDDTSYPFSTHCNLSSTNTRNGYACTAWVIAKGNMDYLKHDISW